MGMFQFCKDHIARINFLIDTVDNMNDIQAFLTKRFEASITLPGTINQSIKIYSVKVHYKELCGYQNMRANS